MSVSQSNPYRMPGNLLGSNSDNDSPLRAVSVSDSVSNIPSFQNKCPQGHDLRADVFSSLETGEIGLASEGTGQEENGER